MSEENSVSNPEDPCIALLERMLDLARRGIYNEEIKSEIVETNTCFVTGIRDLPDPDTVKYIFTGWWIHKHLESKDTDGSGTATLHD